MDFAVRIYELTRRFPKEELYALTSQLRGAAVSGPSKIAEGAAGRTQQPFSNYLSNAIGSFNEIDTQLEWRYVLVMSQGVNLIARSRALDECLALTYGLRKSVGSKH